MDRLIVAGGRDDRPEGQPVVATISGVEVVTITLAEFGDLPSAKRQLAEFRAKAKPLTVPPRSPIDADAEVSRFLADRLGNVPVWEIIRECAERFGTDRTPSRSATYLFWQRLRARSAAP